MNIFILTAEHFSVPGLTIEAHANATCANASAALLVAKMANDHVAQRRASRKKQGSRARTPEPSAANAENWLALLEELQDWYGAAHCYVTITTVQLQGKDMREELLKTLASWETSMEMDEREGFDPRSVDTVINDARALTRA